MSFEDDLKSTLHRRSAPPGFAERVIAAAGAQQRIHVVPKRPAVFSRWAAVAAGVAALVLVPALIEQRHDREREAIEGARAEKQVMLALHLTKAKLKQAQTLLRETSER